MFARQTVYDTLLLAALVTALTFAAAWVYPIWDDGRLMLAIQEFGSDAIWTNFGHRPLIAVFYVFLLKHNLFAPVGIALHWTGWLSMGLVTRHFWRVIFPAQAEFGLLPALLSVAPILCKMQTVLLVMPTIDVIPVVLTFVALFMILSAPHPKSKKIIVYALALFIIAFMVFVSEYAVVTATVAAIFIAAQALFSENSRRRELKVMAALIMTSTVISYVIFLLVTRNSGRDAYRPSYISQVLSLRMPFRLVSGIWRGALGGLLESLGSITFHSKIALLSFVCGLVMSLLVVLAVKRTPKSESSPKRPKLLLAVLIVATAVALVPVVLMNRTLDSTWDSRFWLPALPVLSCLSVYLLLAIIKTRIVLIVPFICGFLAAYWTTWEVASAIQNRELLRKAVYTELSLSTNSDGAAK